MQAVWHSPFLQALGYAIANSLWQVALLWLVVIALNAVFNFSAATRYRVALTAQFSAFAWFLITFKVYFQQCTAAANTLDSLEILRDQAWIVAPEATSFRTAVLAWSVKIEQLLPFLSVAYLFLLGFLGIKWMASYRKAQHVRTNGLQKIDVEWRLFVQKVASQLDIKPKVNIFLSSVVNSPLTIGYLKPVILIPVASITHLTPQQLEALILHELAHIKRADYLINLLQSVIEITLFFNPFIQLLSKQIRNERENSCDDWVLQFQYNPSMYAEALLRIAHLQAAPVLAMHARGSGSELLPRVKRMLNQQEKSFNYKQHLVALLIMTGIFSVTAWLQSGRTGNAAYAAAAASKDQQPLVLEPITSRVDNPLFNPVFFLARAVEKNETEKADKKTEAPERNIRTVDAARLQETLTEPVITAREQDSIAEDRFSEADDARLMIATAPMPPLTRHMQKMQEMMQPGIAAEVFQYQFRIFNRQQHPHLRFRIPPPPPPVARNRQPHQFRDQDPMLQRQAMSAMLMRRLRDSVRREDIHENISHALSTIFREVDSTASCHSGQVHMLKAMPHREMLNMELIGEALRVFDRRDDTWAYFRPVIRERESRTRTGAEAVTIAANSGTGTATMYISREEVTAVQPAAPPQYYHQQANGAGVEKAVQTVTYQYKDVTITISSTNAGINNGNQGQQQPQQQLITIRKIVKETHSGNQMPATQSLLADEQPMPVNNATPSFNIQHD